MDKNNGKVYALRCFGYSGKSDGKNGHYAVCIDLGLVTWRPSILEAKESLDDAIRGYLDTVIKLVKEGQDVGDLFPRPAPFFPYRLHYHLVFLLLAVFGRRILRDPVVYDSPIDCPLPQLV